MLQLNKFKSFEEYISELKLSKIVFSCLLIIASIFAGICCQINQTEQNSTYVKQYLSNKKGYYSNLVSLTRRQITEKYYGSQSKGEEFSKQFRNTFYASLSQNPDQDLKGGVVLMQLKYLNDYFSEIVEQTINQNSFESHLNHFLDLRFTGQTKFSNVKDQILNNFAAKLDQILSKERIAIDPSVLESFISPMVELYYNQLLTISHSNIDQYQQNPMLRFFIINLPTLLFLILLIIGYFFYSGVFGRLIIFCVALSFFFLSFLLQLLASNHNIDLTYNQINFTDSV